MAIIAAAALNSLLDPAVGLYMDVFGDSSEYGLATDGEAWGAAGKVADITTAILALADNDVKLALLPSIPIMKANAEAGPVAKRALGSFLERLNGDILANSPDTDVVTSLETYLKYLNIGAGGTWAALQHPNWKELYTAWRGVAPARYNLYFEVLQGATYTNALRSLVVGGAETAGVTIGSSYAGGFPYLKVSGFTGASDTVTVTGTQYDRATQTTDTGRTWTATVNANGDFALTGGGVDPADANALILACSDIAAGANILASTTIYVEARRPSGRPLLP